MKSKIIYLYFFSYLMMSDGDKAFNTKRELFTEYSEKNRYLLDLIRKERRKFIDEKNCKKNSKTQRNNSFEKEKKRKSLQSTNLNSFTKTVKTNLKIKSDSKDRTNNFSTKSKLIIK